MATVRCTNVACGVTDPGGEWRRGWELRSGGFASLCVKCGMAYEQSAFCDIFHQKESGWRECCSCGKRLHCGCIASKSFFHLLDTGGVQCTGCMKNLEVPSMPSEVIQSFLSQHHQRVNAPSPKSSKENDADTAVTGRTCEMSATTSDSKIDVSKFVKGKGMQNADLEPSESEIRSFGHIKWEQHSPEVGITSLSNRYPGPVGSSLISLQDEKDFMTDKSICESLAQSCLSMSLLHSNQGSNTETCNSAGKPFLALHMACSMAEGKDERNTLSALQQMQRPQYILAKPLKTCTRSFSEASKNGLPYMRVARPPAEGRNQLLPRYWPRITDQELQQISGDSNSTIVPLFEKVLSASDAGRIGRLVLPKACAEAYFPRISQPEGVPLTIQDTKGKDWHFQFRFWPNNNSRMYVLEGVTPCIQSLQLQAGDTVTFSRIDPEGKLVMGYRKATNTVPLQDSQISAIANGTFGNETLFTGISENVSAVSGYSGLLQSLKGSMDPYLSPQSEHLNLSDGEISWHKGGTSNEGMQLQPLQKRTRNIGAKSRRLLMNTDDALELKLTWEEAQELLRPPPSAKPSIVMIEDYEVEEYDEPPIFGKKTIFTARPSGEQDQWVQCDDCYKWRRLPVDVLLLSKWSCADNTWDPKRSSCSAPDELSQQEMQMLLRQYEDLRRQRTSACFKQDSSQIAASSLDALAAAAALGDVGNQTTTPYATTTKHPRHRPGCTCIVCIQPPSGKGPKHDPTCTCNVCMTVKRRFKTLMMRKRKRQSEREEAEVHKKAPWGSKEEVEGTSSSSKGAHHLDPHQENEFSPVSSRTIVENVEVSQGQIDLNCHPVSHDSQAANPRNSMMSLLQDAYRPLETYLKQNGLTSLASQQSKEGSPSSLTVPQAPGESEGKVPDESHFASASKDQEGGDDEGDGGTDMATSDAS
ncbi:B3 domain-containing protein [Musa troglodytarum]|uniref:B3 domain-containing protein n=1 Tax=Musa troglodytarum TaxID=320322 RepID=A0A9E7L846_9LILI|nr:B3 domain-containing protein [Musa troglodytarum]